MKNFKMLAAGILIGATLATSVSAFAELPMLQAFDVSHYKIKVDGKNVDVPQGMTILNYDNRTYTPAKLIVEAMGGQVTFDDTNQIVNIKKPAPEVREVVKEVEKPVYVEVQPKAVYFTAPVTKMIGDIKCTLQSTTTNGNTLYIDFEVENNGQRYIVFDYPKFRILADGKEYLTNGNADWGNSIGANGDKKKAQIYFNSLPEKAKNISIILPYKLESSDTVSELRYDLNIEN